MSSDVWSPASYGQSCVGCAKAKSKCFRRPGDAMCERCVRLGRSCQVQETSRKRKAPSSPSSSRLEQKLDDIASLLRQQLTQGQPTPIGAPSSSHLEARALPEISIDTNSASVQLLRARNRVSESTSRDIEPHHILHSIAERRLTVFRQCFIPVFPFVHLPPTAQTLREQNPFLWLVIMSLASTDIEEQYALESTIWRIIADRIIIEHQANLDLLLGLVGFASWSHYYKQDRPFMDMLTQMALSLARDIGLPRARRDYNMEERRTLVALHHLDLSSWMAYRGSEPRTHPDFRHCVHSLLEHPQYPTDRHLAAQVRCSMIAFSLYGSPEPSTRGVRSWMLQELDQIKAVVDVGDRNMEYYFASTESLIRYSGGLVQQTDDHIDMDHLVELSALLRCAKHTAELFRDMPVEDLVGVSVDVFTRLLHALVVLFKLNTLDKPGWDLVSVREEANVFDVLNKIRNQIESVPGIVCMKDEPTGRSGLFFKTGMLLQGIASLFMSEVPSEQVASGPTTGSSLANVEEFRIPDEMLAALSGEAWLSEIFGPAGAQLWQDIDVTTQG